MQNISIVGIFLSTPSVRRATQRRKGSNRTDDISIHALREEGDALTNGYSQPFLQFLSTPSVRRATFTYYDPRLAALGISIHALREEGDDGKPTKASRAKLFLSTPSVRRATYAMIYNEWFRDISIHALREEGDRNKSGQPSADSYFYPRPP